MIYENLLISLPSRNPLPVRWLRSSNLAPDSRHLASLPDRLQSGYTSSIIVTILLEKPHGLP